MRVAIMENGAVLPEGSVIICAEGEYTLLNVGGKPRWVKNVKDDGKERLWDALPSPYLKSLQKDYMDCKDPHPEISRPGKILEYL